MYLMVSWGLLIDLENLHISTRLKKQGRHMEILTLLDKYNETLKCVVQYFIDTSKTKLRVRAEL